MRLLVKWLAALGVSFTAAAAHAEWRDATEGRGGVLFLTEVGASLGAPDQKGLGLSLDFDAYRTEAFGLRLGLGYFQLESLRASSPFSPPYRSDLDTLYLSFGPLLRLPLRRLSPYLSGGAGLYLSDYDAFFAFQVSGGATGEAALGGGSINLGLHGGAGVDLEIGGGLGLGAEVRYTQVLAQGRNLGLLGLHVGMLARFK